MSNISNILTVASEVATIASAAWEAAQVWMNHRHEHQVHAKHAHNHEHKRPKTRYSNHHGLQMSLQPAR